MSFLPWILLAVLAVIVVWMMMGSGVARPGLAPNGQPYPIANPANIQANNSDATARAIAQSVASAFSLVTQLVNNSNKP